MTTPEGKVKDKVKKILKEKGLYFFMPPMNGYGSSGVPDIIACQDGHFIGIECKANGNKTTALQEKQMTQIREHGGTTIVVDETGVGVLALLLSGPFLKGGEYRLSKNYVWADESGGKKK